MPPRIEDYALIGDCQSAALVSRDGSIDWLCWPRFDSGACFAALLGDAENGRWRLGPMGEVKRTSRKYRGETLVLETEFETDEGVVAVIDCMPPRTAIPDLVRVVEGRRGRVSMRTELVIRFDYGCIVPWVTSEGNVHRAIAGPDMLRLIADVPLRGEGLSTVGDFTVSEGQRLLFNLAWYPSHVEEPPFCNAEDVVTSTEDFWREWVRPCGYQGPWRDAVIRSLITLKSLTYAPTGGIVAAATTSLPEALGGPRNWDYRYCWLRDATFTLYALLDAGFHTEAAAWREWLLRAAAGDPARLQIMYGLSGERRLTEFEIGWLPGYEGSKPVRVGNAAHGQFQLDVYGEVLDAMHQCRRAGLPPEAAAWSLERALLDFLESAWAEPDEGIWEVRGPRRQFTHSKVMAWVALDRAVKAAEQWGMPGPLDRWRALRERIHAEVCQKGFDSGLGSFVQSFGARELDASLLMIPLVGFLPPTDPRVRGTVAAIERGLMRDGLVARYEPASGVDGLPGGEGTFLACSFWLADNYALLGRRDDARRLFERLLSIRNDVGLLAEQYDTRAKRLVGNFPQAFSHVALVNTARNLADHTGPAEDRRKT